jgi:hypothetical protein
MPSTPIRGRYPIPSPDGYTPAELDYSNTFTQPNTFSDDVTVEGTLTPTGGLNSVKLNETKGAGTIATITSTHGTATIGGAGVAYVPTVAATKDTSTIMVSVNTSAAPVLTPRVATVDIHNSTINVTGISNAAVAVVTIPKLLADYGIDAVETFTVYISGVTSSTSTAADAVALAAINGVWQTGTRNGASTFTIAVDTSVVGVGVLTGGTCTINRITSVTAANPAVVTLAINAASELPPCLEDAAGVVYVSGVVSSAALAGDRTALANINNHYFVVDNRAGRTMELVGCDTSAATGALTGGTYTFGNFTITGTVADTVNWWILD